MCVNSLRLSRGPSQNWLFIIPDVGSHRKEIERGYLRNKPYTENYSLVSFTNGFGFPDGVIIYLRGFIFAICYAQLIAWQYKETGQL